MTVAEIGLFEPGEVRKGFNYVRKTAREKFDNMTLAELKEAYREAIVKAEKTGKVSDQQTAEYLNHNIKYIQLCRGVI